MALAGVLSAHAKLHHLSGNEDKGYTFLTFEMTDGAKVSLAVSSLTLTISGNTLTAGSQTFTLSNLSDTDETTGIEEVSIASINDTVDIYDMQGHKILKEQLQKGVYIIKTKNITRKILVK